MKSTITSLLTVVIFACSAAAQSPQFTEPWKHPNIALAIDPYERNEIDWEKLATDKRVVAIIHRATIGDRADRKYTERRDEAKQRGYKWGAYHFGRPGDPIKQADFFLRTVKPAADELIALDLESMDEGKDMSLEEARVFIKRIKETTGRYPLIYANNEVAKAISFRVVRVAADERIEQVRHEPERHLAITVKEERYVSGATKFPPLLSPLQRSSDGTR